ncbi:hypothetical protein IB276_05640 [Ensifer sp. ENS04]|uniref:alpha-isopropylmalate synthase regulatory domain-containing protein n=1 Tax=Ensifer sp. ENS04 TaxID=2769281 RepID=UPI00177DA660|nr:alpha-isopropylmalate synthase regulatory domain-containing protein [Ensifer sp. ENS04]MBD9538922.1 hypothetical protein [Ensifer sp. ENS04]
MEHSNSLAPLTETHVGIAPKQTHERRAAYLQCTRADGTQVFGVGIDNDVATATVKAVLSAASCA